MTTATTETPTGHAGHRSRLLARFGIAFVVGALAVLVVGVGALYAFDRTYAGRILPGVWVGAVDVSGLGPTGARQALEEAYGHLGAGQVVLSSPDRDLTLDFSQLGRRADVDAMVDAALRAGRSGHFLDHIVGGARTAISGVVIQPAVTHDPLAVDAAVGRVADALAVDPVDATLARDESGFPMTDGTPGRAVDVAALRTALVAAIAPLDAPSELTLDVPLLTVEPEVTTAEVTTARDAAERVAQDLVLRRGDEHWTLSREQLLPLVRINRTVDGGVVATWDVAGVRPLVDALAKEIARSPKNASFVIEGNTIAGVSPGREGRRLDVAKTTDTILGTLRARRDGTPAPAAEPTITVRQPALTTAEAEAAAPKMRRISRWTTYFPISEKNGFGANIWIPTLDIDGYVVAPGEWFDFWKAVGPITRARGYRDGGAIINGRTEPQGALAGGICSCSTTLFNAALRAGYEMGARRNHYYYIDRYPLGLDATVFKSSSGSVQTMSWRNDTDYPVLIRGYRIRDGSAGYVRFDLWSVPTGRKVSFSKPIVKNVRRATDTTQQTSTLPAGTTKRIEYPVDGKDVWVTRTVRDRNGTIIHRETYYSHYARITGIVLVGTG